LKEFWLKDPANDTTGQPESARSGFLLYVGSYILAIKLG
jgi:hypothetical protein